MRLDDFNVSRIKTTIVYLIALYSGECHGMFFFFHVVFFQCLSYYSVNDKYSRHILMDSL